jgi:hypothetical protein
MPSMFSTELTPQSTDVLIEDSGILQLSEGQTAVWSERRPRSEGTADDDDDTATQEQQHARRRNTYKEHLTHIRHRAHVPSTDGLIEGSRHSTAQRGTGGRVE